MHDDAHDQTHHDVQRCDEQACHCVTLHEFGNPVERAEEIRLGQFLFAAQLCLGMVDGPCRHVAVDGKLSTRHPVERESRADLGHAAGAFCDDDEIDDQKHAEDHETEQDAAAHDEIGEAFDDVTGCVRSRMALPDDQLGGGNVEGKPQQKAGQKDSREGGKIERAFDEDRDGQHQDRKRKGQREADIEHPGRNRQHHHGDHRHQGQGEKDGRLKNLTHRETWHGHGAAPMRAVPPVN